MKKLIFIAVIAVIIGGCNTPKKKAEESQRLFEKENIVTKVPPISYHLITLEHDSCEYILWNDFRAIQMIHKENCKFCKNRK